MKRSTFNISMPETMRKYVEQRAGGGGYGSVSEYIRELIRQDQDLVRRAPLATELRDPPRLTSAARANDRFGRGR